VMVGMYTAKREVVRASVRAHDALTAAAVRRWPCRLTGTVHRARVKSKIVAARAAALSNCVVVCIATGPPRGWVGSTTVRRTSQTTPAATFRTMASRTPSCRTRALLSEQDRAQYVRGAGRQDEQRHHDT